MDPEIGRDVRHGTTTFKRQTHTALEQLHGDTFSVAM
jgi:hypothetical protein